MCFPIYFDINSTCACNVQTPFNQLYIQETSNDSCPDLLIFAFECIPRSFICIMRGVSLLGHTTFQPTIFHDTASGKAFLPTVKMVLIGVDSEIGDGDLVRISFEYVGHAEKLCFHLFTGHAKFIISTVVQFRPLQL